MTEVKTQGLILTSNNLNDNDKVKVLNKTDSIINNDVPLKRKKKNNEVSKLQNSVDKEG